MPQEHIAPFDLETFVKEAATLNQRTLEAFTIPFPKAPNRWLSHYQFKPRPIEFTPAGEVEGGLSWLIGATIDVRFTRALFAPYYSKEGGHCDDPASSFFLELASRVDRYSDYASFCADLRQQEKGRRYRELAGLHAAIPGEDDLSHFRRRVDASAIEAALAVFVGLFRAFGLVTGELLATDGQLEPSYSRFKGCAYFCPDCQQLPVDEASRQELCRQLQAGAKRLEIRCPFPEVVQKVLHATRKQGKPREPKVALLEIEYVPADSAQTAEHQQLSEGSPCPQTSSRPYASSGPTSARVRRESSGAAAPRSPPIWRRRLDTISTPRTRNKTERVFGYLQQTTTNIDVALGLELPVGTSTSRPMSMRAATSRSIVPRSPSRFSPSKSSSPMPATMWSRTTRGHGAGRDPHHRV